MSETPPLPIDGLLPQLRSTLHCALNAVLQAPPGAGKTTRVPIALLDAPWLAGRSVLMLEPRRLAARNAAAHMSALLGQRVGETVGYRVRLDSRIGPGTRIEVVTEGVLIRLLQDDPELSRYGVVIFDEFHERSLLADLGLALTLDVQGALREDLRLVVMSATLDGGPVATLLGGALLLSSAGRSFPVTIRHQAPAQATPSAGEIAATIRRALASEPGSILVFLPGEHAIRRVAELLADGLPSHCQVVRLHGDLPAAAQDAAIRPAAPGTRKIVLSTNIAETSLTIEGVRIVIDSGLERRARFDPASGMGRLHTQQISQAAASQRAGRAGRLEPGLAIRLWSAEQHTRLRPFTTPEMLSADLAALALELAHWGCGEPGALRWLDPPPPAAWAQARDLLRQLGALDENGRLSAHGRAMQALGVHPRLAHMLLRAQSLGWQATASALAALLTERDPLPGIGSDIGLRLRQLQQAQGGNWQQLRAQARAFRQRLPGPTHETTDDAVGRLLCYAFPDRIAQRRPGLRPAYLLANGRGAALADDDPLGMAAWLVVASVDGQPPEARIRLASALSAATLETACASRIEEVDHVRWDDARETVLATRQRRLGALVLGEQPLAAVSPSLLSSGLLDAIRRRGLQLLRWEEHDLQWQARVMLLHALEPTQWPAVDDTRLLATLDTWLAPFLGGMRSLADVRKLPLRDALDALLTHAQRQRLSEEAPSRITVPSGSSVVIDYRAAGGPALAVKLQELFGTTRTPSIARGRIPLTLQLLSPARRPVQITRDLAGFWSGSYAQVRKDLRGRYPKHPWPEDPATAAPTRHTKRAGGG
jgi:ATP-dependent helicase HrpB